jgi:hypothetical protein
MVSIDRPHPRTIHRRGDVGPAAAGHLLCLLAFSLGGLLMDCLALVLQGATSLAPLGFALTAGAPLLAAMAALHFAGNTDEPCRGMRMGKS